MNYSAFHIANRIVEHMIRKHTLQQSDLADIRFDVPDAEFVAALPSKPVINVYLNRITDNLERRQSETMRVASVDSQGMMDMVYRPRFINLHYIVSVWSKSSDASDALNTESFWLSNLIQSLGRFTHVPHSVLKVADSDFEPSPFQVEISLLDDPIDMGSQGEFWSALGSRPKPIIQLNIVMPVDVWQDVDTRMPQVKNIRSEYKKFANSAVRQGLSEDDLLANNKDNAYEQSRMSVVGNIAFANNKYPQDHRIFIKRSDGTVDSYNINQDGHYFIYDLPAGEYEIGVASEVQLRDASPMPTGENITVLDSSDNAWPAAIVWHGQVD
ncbi:DUF4255 domain-containing protein [Pseudoalteromonas sp. JBTF-M23]|uniref:DUF4255 domain-containing protein n=1 Tax=Pseudoalteromonas caenipelagi TaxID=2726988 RepID=A0A849VCK4_9GAMM|nr:Pvc16 family protein [Pseudoalteromonas caenipelagi]NOU50558.1 DUF4255 domain-containing protein [Pseudoalteromonas caenipelagi]